MVERCGWVVVAELFLNQRPGLVDEARVDEPVSDGGGGVGQNCALEVLVVCARAAVLESQIPKELLKRAVTSEIWRESAHGAGV